MINAKVLYPKLNGNTGCLMLWKKMQMLFLYHCDAHAKLIKSMFGIHDFY